MEASILERVVEAMKLPPLPKREPCPRHALAGSGYVVRCYSCEVWHEPKLMAWVAAIPEHLEGVTHGTASGAA